MMCKDIYDKYKKKLSSIVSIEDELSIILYKYKYEVHSSDTKCVRICSSSITDMYNYLQSLRCFNLQVEKNTITVSHKEKTVASVDARSSCIVNAINIMFQRDMKKYANENNIFASSSKLSDEYKSQQKTLLREYNDTIKSFRILLNNFKVAK